MRALTAIPMKTKFKLTENGRTVTEVRWSRTASCQTIAAEILRLARWSRQNNVAWIGYSLQPSDILRNSGVN